MTCTRCQRHTRMTRRRFAWCQDATMLRHRCSKSTDNRCSLSVCLVETRSHCCRRRRFRHTRRSGRRLQRQLARLNMHSQHWHSIATECLIPSSGIAMRLKTPDTNPCLCFSPTNHSAAFCVWLLTFKWRHCSLGGTWKRISLSDIRDTSTLEPFRGVTVSRNRAMQIDIYLLTYLLTYTLPEADLHLYAWMLYNRFSLKIVEPEITCHETFKWRSYYTPWVIDRRRLC